MQIVFEVIFSSSFRLYSSTFCIRKDLFKAGWLFWYEYLENVKVAVGFSFVFFSIAFCFLDWRWMKGKKQIDNYYNVLNAFIDKKDSYYSIHQIGKMITSIMGNQMFQSVSSFLIEVERFWVY